MSTATDLVLALTSFGAATVYGAVGYGYSSITVPIALLVVAGRVLNPALVIVEVAINLYALCWNRAALRRVLPRVLPLSAGLVPGVIVGSLLLGHVAPSHIKLGAYLVLFPLILMQSSGGRWPIQNERRAAVPLGGGIGLLYGLTTISGPPLAMFWNNQGLAKEDFRASIAIVRTIESVCALGAYAVLGLFNRESIGGVLPWVAPGVLIGLPLGARLIQRVTFDTFRRVCISFDVYLVAFGLARTLGDTGLAPYIAYQLLPIAAVIDTRFVLQFFRIRRSGPIAAGLKAA